MINKSVLIGTFIKKNKILCFLENLKNNYNIQYDKIFVFSIKHNTNEYLVTFRANDKEIFLSEINGSTVMHVKNGCLFSINALNKLIENENGTKNKDYKINWDLYKDKLIILTNGNLSIDTLNKINDKSLFFN